MAQKRATFIPANSDELQEKFINCMMQRGKKSTSRNILKNTLQILKEKGHKKPQDFFHLAIKNVSPQVEVRPKRIGGSIYQIPVEVKPHRQNTLAIRWIINAAKARKGMKMAQKLALELIDAVNEAGEAFKKRDNVHKMAQANRAFAHLANF